MLSGAIDYHQVVGLAVAVAFSLAIVVVPWIARTRCLLLASLLAAFIYYWREFIGFVLVSTVAYLVVHWLSRQNASRRWPWACLSILALAVIFVCGRIGHWDRLWLVPFTGGIALFSLGMWPMLKLVTLFWEVGSGAVAAPSPSQYLVWACLPFTLGGPVLRWSQMSNAWLGEAGVFKSGAWWLESAAATAKMVMGVSLGVGQTLLANHWHSHIGNNAVTTFLTGPFSFYLTAAGYFHWMQLLGRPCGIKIPESFNFPMGRENISAFWMNWNMTATYVFRDYIFYNRWGMRTFNVYFNTILLFTLVGLWHAGNAYWVLWGFLHGLLFTCYLLWRKFGNRLGPIPLRGTPLSRMAARLLTYFAVCMCWYLPSKILQKLAVI